jgi:hypothetical protein
LAALSKGIEAISFWGIVLRRSGVPPNDYLQPLPVPTRQADIKVARLKVR